MSDPSEPACAAPGSGDGIIAQEESHAQETTVGILAVTVAVAAAAVTSMMAGQVGSASAAAALDPAVAPGGNFNLSVWQLQLPTGSPGRPPPFAGPTQRAERIQEWLLLHRQDQRFDDLLGTREGRHHAELQIRPFRAARDELQRHRGGLATSRHPPAERDLRVTQVPKSVAVGQVHLGSGGVDQAAAGALLRASGNITLGIENSPAGGQTLHKVGNVPLEHTVELRGRHHRRQHDQPAVNGGSTRTWTIPSSFNGYGMYFKAGSYNQSSSSSTTRGRRSSSSR